MQGHVSKYRADLGVGIIRGEDGRSYRFMRSDILNPASGLVGEDVDFEIEARQPRAIILTSGSPWTAYGAPTLADVERPGTRGAAP